MSCFPWPHADGYDSNDDYPQGAAGKSGKTSSKGAAKAGKQPAPEQPDEQKMKHFQEGPLLQLFEKFTNDRDLLEDFKEVVVRLRRKHAGVRKQPDNPNYSTLEIDAPYIKATLDIFFVGPQYDMELLDKLGWTYAAEIRAFRWAGVASPRDGDTYLLNHMTSTIYYIERLLQERAAPNRWTTVARPEQNGWTPKIFSPGVLDHVKGFKGAVWERFLGHLDGVVCWHNSMFSNWWKCESKVLVRLGDGVFRYDHSEGILMAYKEHLCKNSDLRQVLREYSFIPDAGVSKQTAGGRCRDGDYTWWSHHGMQCLLGTVTCWYKFSQDERLKERLLATRNAVLCETAPNDGSWGVAKDSGGFLKSVRDGGDDSIGNYDLSSVEEQEIEFEVRGLGRVKRQKCQSNALGKSLMVVRDMLKSEEDLAAASQWDLQDCITRVCTYFEKLGATFDYTAAKEHLQTPPAPPAVSLQSLESAAAPEVPSASIQSLSAQSEVVPQHEQPGQQQDQ